MFVKLQSFFEATIGKIESRQNEREAVIELMILTMYIDKSLKLVEEDTINDYVSSVAWESPITIEQFLAKTFPKIRNAISDNNKLKTLLEDINSRISNNETKSELLKTCQKLAVADGEISQVEKEFLAEVAKYLQIPHV